MLLIQGKRMLLATQIISKFCAVVMASSKFQIYTELYFTREAAFIVRQQETKTREEIILNFKCLTGLTLWSRGDLWTLVGAEPGQAALGAHWTFVKIGTSELEFAFLVLCQCAVPI